MADPVHQADPSQPAPSPPPAPSAAPEHIEGLVDTALARGARRLVLPAEVSAGQWRKRLARRSGCVWADNVVSWDRFKEEAFGAYEERRPANRLMRRIFAEHYLKANAVRPRLERLIAPSYAAYSGRYAAALTLLLPHLVALRSAAGALRSTTGATASGPHGVSAVRRDLEQLHAAYGSFLDEHGLFEPQWRSATLTEPAEMTALIACDLATDFPEYHPALEKSDRILLLGAPRWFRSSARLRRYPTVAQEITDVLLRVEALLADGVPGHEIAVTVGDLPTLRDRIQLEASARGVPIVIRQGRPLAEYSAVALFPLMASAVSEDFRFERFRDLVLHGAVPWRDRGELRRRLTAAAARGILRITDVDATLGALARRIRGIATAQTFAAIRERLYVFFAQYLDTGSLPADQERAFQAALDVLTELAREEERGLPVLEDPFGFFVSLLADRQYVPRDEAGGVAVYPYRVSACIAPQHHFVLNCSQSATKVSGAGAVQLIPETDHEALGIDAYDVSHAMLGAYAASGDAVTFTFSDRGPGGAQLPAESFTTASLQELADRLEDPLDLERRYLGGESPTPPERVYPAQRSGLSHIIGSVERAAEGDRAVTAAPVPPELWRRRDDKGNADIPTEITVSELERYWNCPLGYLMEFVYGVRDPDTVPLPADPRHIGTLYHRVLQRLYEWIKERDGVLDASHGERYREQAREIAREVLSKSATPLRDVAEYAYLALLDQITDFVITWDLDNFDGYEVYALEAPFSYPSEAAPVAGDLMGLRGRIDRVLRNSETGDVVVADYKRRNMPGRRTIELELTDRPAAVPGAADPDRELSLQMAAYAYLLERNGLTVEAALYFNLEEAKTSLVYGGAGNPWLNREQLDTLIARIEERLSALPGRLRDGDFRVPTPDWGCAACRMRGVCRERFVVR